MKIQTSVDVAVSYKKIGPRLLSSETAEEEEEEEEDLQPLKITRYQVHELVENRTVPKIRSANASELFQKRDRELRPSY